MRAASCGWTPTTATTSGSRSARATARRMCSRLSPVPTVTKRETPAARARASTSSRSASKASPSTWPWLSISVIRLPGEARQGLLGEAAHVVAPAARRLGEQGARVLGVVGGGGEGEQHPGGADAQRALDPGPAHEPRQRRGGPAVAQRLQAVEGGVDLLGPELEGAHQRIEAAPVAEAGEGAGGLEAGLGVRVLEQLGDPAGGARLADDAQRAGHLPA